MRAWQVLGLSALLLNGLVVLALVFTGNMEKVNSVLAGAVIPLLISGGLLVWAEYSKTKDPQYLQKLNIIGFLIKIVLLGAWATLLIKAGNLDNVIFIVMLVINFLAWHGVEAYYWRLFMADTGQKQGEIS